MKTKSIPVGHRDAFRLDGLPNFSRTGSITGMKRRFYGLDAKLMRRGRWIYNCTTTEAINVYDRLP